MNVETNFLGCFVSGPSVNWDDDAAVKDSAKEQGRFFRTYIWGEEGICDALKKLKHSDYGSDLAIILFQFYLNPIPYELDNLKEIESYRKKEKSIGIPIVVNQDNFFCRTDAERRGFLKTSILEKLDLLEDVVKNKKLDSNIKKLKSDLEILFSLK